MMRNLKKNVPFLISVPDFVEATFELYGFDVEVRMPTEDEKKKFLETKGNPPCLTVEVVGEYWQEEKKEGDA